MRQKKILLLGVTASGKNRLAFELAQYYNAELISVDSMKIYRRMDIGTAKPTQEAQRQVKYHLIDIVEPSESFSVGRFLELAEQAIGDIAESGKNIIAVGGTALYIKAMLYGLFDGPASDENIRQKLKQQAKEEGLEKLHQYLEKIDPVAADNIHPNDAKRIIRALEVYEITGKPISSFQRQFDAAKPKDNWLIIGIRRDKAEENKRLNARVKKMLEAGLVDEVKSLLTEETPLSKQARCAIGYAEIIEYIEGKITLDEATELIKKNTRRFAKSQRTWFKTFKDVNWLDIPAAASCGARRSGRKTDESFDSIIKMAKELIEEKANRIKF
ncbi:MAG: tRNA (adenosine(37)-N6)-dimethylallyltransferase MiaA [Sedimentisphaerales bacterium]|nr:tRNA (adenosine(37)-N6)-dimethylallyltransferase MiaA [Sedimentisphaerales bacterium]